MCLVGCHERAGGSEQQTERRAVTSAVGLNAGSPKASEGKINKNEMKA